MRVYHMGTWYLREARQASGSLGTGGTDGYDVLGISPVVSLRTVGTLNH